MGWYMYRCFFSFFIFCLISIITFLITTFSIEYIKFLDPIMIKIKSNKDNFESGFVNAYIDDDNIIPGISGSVVNLDESFKIMKKYGSYNEKLLVFSKVNPELSVSNIFDKYIRKGNGMKKEVSFIFTVIDTNYLEEIVFILNENNVIGTFFIDENVFLNSFDILKFLYFNNQNIEYMGSNMIYTKTNLLNFSFLLKNYFNIKNRYCYTSSYNKSILDVCSQNGFHTIFPSINIDNYPYHYLKDSLSNGLIISFNNRELLLDELNYIIAFIRQKGYEIVSLEKLLEE